MVFAVEVILDNEKLYRRVRVVDVVNGEALPSAFNLSPDGMSVDWERYRQNPQDMIDSQRDPTVFAGVVAFIAGRLRYETFDVMHRPTRKNQAHSLVVKEDNEKYRLLLSRIVEKRWILQTPSFPQSAP
jgi:hypothetical protein